MIQFFLIGVAKKRLSHHSRCITFVTMFYTKLKNLVLATFILAAGNTFSQSIISPSDTIFAALDTLNELHYGEISIHWDVINESDTDMVLMCTRNFIDTVSPFNYPYVQSTEGNFIPGAYEKFCWGPLCYNFGTDASSSNSSMLVTILPSEINNTFIAYYYPNDIVGTTTMEYCFHPVGDDTMSSCKQMTYVISATAGLEEDIENDVSSAITSVYPNPLDGSGFIEYNLRKGEVGILIFRDLTGKEIKRVGGLVYSGKVNIEASEFVQGLSFCTLEVDGVAVDTERFIVIR
ncbi:MAG: hypothetical protein COA49_04460 [Bacteroidetes bacterium]|nr:MAG: hypothetical protein COA49_04460 [Bacteroidota bacterium]